MLASSGTSSIKMANINTNGNKQCKIVYRGFDNTQSVYKSEQGTSDFIFSKGDQLRYIGYAKTTLQIAGRDVLEDTPQDDETYLFDITNRKILLEDYTGHTCVNCPGATTVALELKEQYPEQVIVLTVHAGWFAQPMTEPYDADFRTVEGEELVDFFGIITNPAGMVNRIGEGAERILGEGEWPSAVGIEVNKPVEASINITNEYNDQTRILSTSLDVKFFNSLPGFYRVCAFIIEDNIVSPQMNNDLKVGPTPDILDYVHMHMLRGSLNSTWGDLLTDGDITIGETYTIPLSDYTLDDAWDEDHCAIVAFVYSSESYEIVQAEDEEVK